MNLFQQVIWTPLGFQRLLILLAIWVVWCAVTGRSRWFVPLTLGVAAVYACALTRDLALPAVLFFLLSATALGTRILGKQDLLLALLAGVSVYVWLASCTAFFPVHYWWTYAVVLTLPMIGAVPLWSWRGTGGPKPRAWTIAVTGFVFLAHYLVALKPEVSSDGLAVHLAFASFVAQHHFWPFDAGNVTWAVMPMGGDWSYAIAYALGGEYAARLLNFGMLIVIAGLLYHAVRRWLSPSLSLLLVALFASSPIVQLETGSLFIENTWAALLLGATIALIRFHESGDRRDAALSAAMLGASLATKFGTVAFAVSPGILLGIAIRRHRGKAPPLRTAGLAAALFLVLALPPYLTAYVKTGNPFFPLMNTVFKSPYYDTTVPLQNSRYKLGLHWNTLYDVTFHTSKYLESHDGGWGFQYIFLIPLAVLLYRKEWPFAARIALPLALVSCALTFLAQSYLRYIYPALPLFMIAAAALPGTLCARSPMLYRVVLVASAAALLMNVYFLPASGWYHASFYLNPFDRAETDRYLDESVPVRNLVDYLNRVHPGQPVAFIQGDQIAGLRGQAYTDTWHNTPFWLKLLHARSPEDCLRLARDKGISNFIAPAREDTIPEMQMRFFLARYTEPEYRHGGYYVARLLEHPERARSQPPLPPGIHEDTDRGILYSGAWTYGPDFPQAAAGTVTYSNEPGAGFRASFSGSRITYVYTRAFNRGMAEVTIDGVVRATLDLYSPAILWQSSTAFDALPDGTHTLLVRVLGRRAPASQDCYIDLDQLIVSGAEPPAPAGLAGSPTAQPPSGLPR